MSDQPIKTNNQILLTFIKSEKNAEFKNGKISDGISFFLSHLQKNGLFNNLEKVNMLEILSPFLRGLKN
jgi:hypothetical protein